MSILSTVLKNAREKVASLPLIGTWFARHAEAMRKGERNGDIPVTIENNKEEQDPK